MLDLYLLISFLDLLWLVYHFVCHSIVFVLNCVRFTCLPASPTIYLGLNFVFALPQIYCTPITDLFLFDIFQDFLWLAFHYFLDRLWRVMWFSNNIWFGNWLLFDYSFRGCLHLLLFLLFLSLFLSLNCLSWVILLSRLHFLFVFLPFCIFLSLKFSVIWLLIFLGIVWFFLYQNLSFLGWLRFIYKFIWELFKFVNSFSFDWTLSDLVSKLCWGKLIIDRLICYLFLLLLYFLLYFWSGVAIPHLSHSLFLRNLLRHVLLLFFIIL